MVVGRGDVYLVALEPTVGHEIAKTRPSVIISPDEMNRVLGTVIVAPMTTKGKPYPTRIQCKFAGRDGAIVLDQLRTVDRQRLIRKIGRLPDEVVASALGVLTEMFAWGSERSR